MRLTPPIPPYMNLAMLLFHYSFTLQYFVLYQMPSTAVWKSFSVKLKKASLLSELSPQLLELVTTIFITSKLIASYYSLHRQLLNNFSEQFKFEFNIRLKNESIYIVVDDISAIQLLKKVYECCFETENTHFEKTTSKQQAPLLNQSILMVNSNGL